MGHTITLLGMRNGNPSLIRVDPGITATIATTLVGKGGLNKADHGTLIVSSDNTYTGGTVISGGTLQIGNGGTPGSIVGDLTNNGVLEFNRSDALTFGGVISDKGSVR
jgi:fibronectin-binding autotransporter adhesin